MYPVYQAAKGGKGEEIPCRFFFLRLSAGGNAIKRSDYADYRKIENDGQNDSRCLSLDTQRDTPTPSAEEAVLAPYIATEQAERRRKMLEQIRASLTGKQYRRLCLYCLEGKTQEEIAALEGIPQQRISKSLISGAKTCRTIFSRNFP